VPQHWLVSKTIPMFKKGDKVDIKIIDKFPTFAPRPNFFEKLKKKESKKFQPVMMLM
jgi:ribosomal protein L21E